MVKRHMLRMSVPASWQIARKTNVFVTRPNCGPHKMDKCLPVSVILKEKLKYTRTTVETKKVLNNKEILVNKKIVKSEKEQIGLFDVLEIPKMKESYRMLFNKNGQLTLAKISGEETGIRVCKIIAKRTIKNKKTQLNLDDGTNLIVAKDDYNLGDSVVVTLPERKPKSTLKLEKGAAVYMIGGDNVGVLGHVEEIAPGTATKKSIITVKTKKDTFHTRTDYAFVVGKDKSVISLE